MNYKNDLKIKAEGENSFSEAVSTYGVKMGKGFIDAIESGVQLKDPIENESRLKHGTQMLVSTKISKRTVTLRFNIHGDSESEYMANKKKFEQMLLKGKVDFVIDDPNHYKKENGSFTDGVYHLVYTGKSVTYNHSYNGKFGVWSAQFIEPNPSNRTEETDENVRVISD